MMSDIFDDSSTDPAPECLVFDVPDSNSLEREIFGDQTSSDSGPLHFSTHQFYDEMDDCDNEASEITASDSDSSESMSQAIIAEAPDSLDQEPMLFPSHHYCDQLDARDELERKDAEFEDDYEHESSEGMEETEVYGRSEGKGEISPVQFECPSVWGLNRLNSSHNQAANANVEISTDELENCDHDALYRLTQLGFSDPIAVQAYFICGKDENAAAEYLLTKNSE